MREFYQISNICQLEKSLLAEARVNSGKDFYWIFYNFEFLNIFLLDDSKKFHKFQDWTFKMRRKIAFCPFSGWIGRNGLFFQLWAGIARRVGHLKLRKSWNFKTSRRFNRYSRKRPKVDASIVDSALSHTRRSDASEKEENSVSTFGPFRLWTSFESSPVSVNNDFL